MKGESLKGKGSRTTKKLKIPKDRRAERFPRTKRRRKEPPFSEGRNNFTLLTAPARTCFSVEQQRRAAQLRQFTDFCSTATPVSSPRRLVFSPSFSSLSLTMQHLTIIRRARWTRPFLPSRQQSAFLSAWTSAASRQPALLRQAGVVGTAGTPTAGAGTVTAIAGEDETQRAFFHNHNGATTHTLSPTPTPRIMAPPHRHITDGSSSPSVHRLAGIAGHLTASSASRPTSTYSSPSSTPSISTSNSRSLHTTSASSSPNMSSQPDHPTLLIPGPIEFDDAVLNSMSHYR